MTPSKRNAALMVLFSLAGMLLLAGACSTPATRPEKNIVTLSWNDLADVTYEEKFEDSIQQFLYWPLFGPTLAGLENKHVRISGYFFPMDSAYKVLSAKPFASCFFCGQAGPETVLELAYMPEANSKKMDAFLTLEGKFLLNNNDPNHLMYILDSVTVVKDIRE